jgi:hypothetical protein
MGLSGCKGNKWDEAYSYYSNAKYQEAYEIFSTLGNYKNSTNLARNSKLIIDIDSAELMIENHEYNRALELLLPYIDDGVDNKYASIDIRNADSTAINLVHKCKSAIEGNWIDTFSLSGNELSGTIFLTSIIDSPRLELRFLTNNDSYIGETYITDPADYGENITYGELIIQNYQTEVGYVFDKLNLSQLSFTIPKAASWYENDIFTPATVSDLYAFSLTGLISTAVSQGGKQGYMPALGALKNIHFSNFQKVFKNGELTVRLLSGNDVYLESVFRIK